MNMVTVNTLEVVGKDVPLEEALPVFLARMMLRIKITESGCWEYQGRRSESGYVQVTFQGAGRMLHKLMYRACAGQEPPDRMDICHSCHNRACFNPYHIRADTHAANLAESSAAGRINGQQLTHCKRGHPLSGDNLLKGKQFRVCAICSRGRYRLRRGWPEDLAFSLPAVAKGYRPVAVRKRIIAAST